MKRFTCTTFHFTCLMKRFTLHFTQQNSVFQQNYQPYYDYLLKMGRMDEEHAELEQLTLTLSETP